MTERSRAPGGEIDQASFEFVHDKDASEDSEWSTRWNRVTPLGALDIRQLQQRVVSCDRCHLRSTCTQVVFGEGKTDAKIMFIGEAPGAQEDQEGRPFVGRSGKLLDKILEACELSREDVYITNIVKCRPPENRTPKPEERDYCMSYLRAQVQLIKPDVIVTLGAAATQGLIDPRARITRMRGRWQEWNGVKVMPTFHPAALLRDPRKKKPVWDDIQKVLDMVKGEN